VADFGGVFKPIPGRSRKAVLLWNWENDNPAPKKLDANIRPEISACTSNALRVLVWKLFCLSVIKDYVEEVLPDELPKSAERTPSLLEAFDNAFETFLSTWKNKNSKEFGTQQVVIIRRLLQSLVFTGPTMKGDLLAWFANRK
jgi:hypothetical protein